MDKHEQTHCRARPPFQALGVVGELCPGFVGSTQAAANPIDESLQFDPGYLSEIAR